MSLDRMKRNSRKEANMDGQMVQCGADLQEIDKRVTGFLESGGKNAPADEKAKQLLLVRLAWERRCRFCAEEQIQSALEAGATQDEVAQVLLMTLARGKWVLD
jgi:AhpD family alkylhydroperoxidase